MLYYDCKKDKTNNKQHQTKGEGKMDKVTSTYRKQQFDKVNTEYFEYQPKIKIIKPNGETNWMDITEEELLKVRALLVY